MIASGDVAFHGADETSGDGEAEAGAAGVDVGAAVEFVEDGVFGSFGDALAVVADGDFEGIGEEGGGDFDGRALRGVGGGVVEDVGEGLGEETAVEFEEREGIEAGGEEWAGAEFFFERRGGGADDVFEFFPVEVRAEGIGFDAGHAEEVVDDVLEPAGGGGDFRGVGVRGGEPVEGGADDGDGGFEFVGDTVEESAVEPFAFSEEVSAVAFGEEGFAFAVVAFEGVLALAEVGGEVAHAEGDDEEESEDGEVARVFDTEGEVGLEEDEIPCEGAENGHEDDRAAVPAGSCEDDGHEEHEGGEEVTGLWEDGTAGGGDGEDDGESAAVLGDEGEGVGFLSGGGVWFHGGEPGSDLDLLAQFDDSAYGNLEIGSGLLGETAGEGEQVFAPAGHAW